MRFRSDAQDIFDDHAEEAFVGAMGDTLGLAQSLAPVDTGLYRSTLQVVRIDGDSGPAAALRSPLGYSRILDSNRPDAPRPLKQAGERFGQTYTARLQATPLRSMR